jgi:hypothetical protein
MFILSKQSMFGVGMKPCSSGRELNHQPGTGFSASLACIRKRPGCRLSIATTDPELTSAVMDILRDRLRICVIGLSLRNNQISIYRGKRRCVPGEDL